MSQITYPEQPSLLANKTDTSRLAPLDGFHTRVVFNNSHQHRLSFENSPDNESTHSVETLQFRVIETNPDQDLISENNLVPMMSLNSQVNTNTSIRQDENLKIPDEYTPITNKSGGFQGRSIATKNELNRSVSFAANNVSELDTKVP